MVVEGCRTKPVWIIGPSIEEVWKQKPRQTVVVLHWGARSNAALGILAGMCSIVYIAVVHFLFTFVEGDDFCRFTIQVFIQI